ncbi:MAG: cytochrome C [Paludibacter sp.]|nr:cytochrome C [Paludibacter sp.]
MKLKNLLLIFALNLVGLFQVSAQISPGDLSNAHAFLEGVSNCTKCHAVGNKVTNDKCLACHQIIQTNIKEKKGYHASVEVAGKQCVTCHNDHHGRNFQLIKFDKNKFNHNLAGFALKGVHAKKECNACHKPAFIKDPRLKKKASTFMGLNQACLTCHADYHQGRMSPNCSKCHSFETFKNATGFDHNTTRFPLIGSHKTVACEKCHKTQIIEGKPVQQFRGLAFANCNDCHKDPHDNKFGQNCKQCHSEVSFHNIKGISTFNHDKTGFPLVGKHKLVTCVSCHKSKNMNAPIKHDRCSDCHADYHNKEFEKRGISPDCNQCHNNDGFTPSTFTIEKHNLTKFSLQGAHLATPCLACHKKDNNKWTFKRMGRNCIDCHKNEHKGFIEDKFMPNDNCTLCHNVTNWETATFDHNKTNFKLDGAHSKLLCSECHYPKNGKGIRVQQFMALSTDCSSCHKNSHMGQFEINGKTDCTRCHTTLAWANTTFNHNTSRFKLEGAHAKVKCVECHKEVTNEKGKYIQYIFKSIACSTCHS